MIRLLLLAVIVYVVIRMVRVFSNLRRGSGSDDALEPPRGGPPGTKPPDDYPHAEIKDAEFIDLTSPEDPPTPPKAS
jgi:hypothetical protein